MKFRKRPMVIEAIQLTTENKAALLATFVPNFETPLVLCSDEDDGLTHAEIATLEGTHRAEIGDWIIRGVAGELYPCKDPIFRATYEPVEERA